MTVDLFDDFLETNEAQLSPWLNEHKGLFDVSFFEDIRLEAEQISREGDLGAALALLKKGELVAEALGESLFMAVIYRGRANVYQHYDHFEESLNASRQATEIYEKQGRQFEAAKAQAIEIFVLGALERFSEAVALAQKIRPVFVEADFPLGEAVATANLARVYMNSHQYEAAQQELLHALKLYEALNQPGRMGRILHDLAVVAESRDQFQEAATYYDRAYPLLLADEDVRTLAKNQFNRAQLNIRQAQFDEALAIVNQVRADTASWDESEDLAFINLFEAQLRRQLGEREYAITLLHKALGYFADSGSTGGQVEVLLELAQTLALNQPSTDEITEAIHCLEQVESLVEPLDKPFLLASASLEKGDFLFQLKRLTEAEQAASYAEELFSEQGLFLRSARAKALVADCCLSGNPTRAGVLYREALEVSEGVNPLLGARCWHGLGRLALGEGELTTAVSAYENALTCIAQVRDNLRMHIHRAGLDNQAIFDELLTALHQQRVLESASQQVDQLLFNWVERLKAQALTDLLTNSSGTDVADPETQALLEERARLRQELDHAYARLNLAEGETREIMTQSRTVSRRFEQQTASQADALQRELQRLEEQIAHRQPWLTNVANSLPTSLPDLPPETLLISYYAVNGELFALTLNQHTAHRQHHTLGVTQQQIQRLWQQTRRWLLRPQGNTPQIQARLSKLWERLMAPLEAVMQDYSRLLIVPYRDLHQIPFAALYDVAHARYLIERWSLHIAPSASVLALCQKQTPATAVPLLVGYPGQPQQPDYLPGVPAEIQALKEVFPTAEVLEADAATVTAVLNALRGRQLVHLAGHVFYDAEYPLMSGMPLADGGWVRASDLYLQHGLLRGAIVTLSGCSSGRGRALGGDVVGLTSAFFYAGARAIIAGLWPVDDAATTSLMQFFYRSLQRGDALDEALRTAQTTLLATESFAHPYYWSPFQLNGAV